MEQMHRSIGVFVILIVLVSQSRQQNDKTEADKKIEAIFGPPLKDRQPSTESPLTPEFLNKSDTIFGTPPPYEQPSTTISAAEPVVTIQQTDAPSSISSGNNGCPVGECLPYFQCLENGVINTSGDNIIDIRFGAGPCPDYLEKCCVLEDQMSNIETSTNAPNTPKPTEKQQCGRRNTEGIGFRIIGDQDNEAHYGEFPYMVAVIKEEPSLGDILNVYISGGSLIHPSVVLTAAHHFHNKNKKNILKIRAGEWDTMTMKEQFPHQDRIVREIIIHEQFYEGGLHNDIALLILQEPVILGDVIDTICLPPQNHSFLGNNNCFASGWGQNAWGNKGKPQVILKKVELPIVSRERCQEKFRHTRLGQHFLLDQSFICAGGVIGQDTCKGDGGSPLVCPIPEKFGHYYQSGIVAWGLGCGSETPAAYVNVGLFRNWIDQKFAEKGFVTNFYTI